MIWKLWRRARATEIHSAEEYGRAIVRMVALTARGLSPETDKEVADLEAAAAAYVSKHGKPDVDLARPPEKTPVGEG